LRKLKQRELEAQALMDRAHNLREHLGQALEIREEDHTKAIRVFTIVTLFFLPLTFVSGLMGMNTVDIRDTEADQRIFWQTAVPLTAGVLTIAFIYGYKWEAIREMSVRWWTRKGDKRLWAREKAAKRPETARVGVTKTSATGTGGQAAGGWVWIPRKRWNNRKTVTKQDEEAANGAAGDSLASWGGGMKRSGTWISSVKEDNGGG
jgi:hypothetical protein